MSIELTGLALDIRNKRADLMIELLEVDDQAKTFCQDVSNTLEQRWALFSQGFGQHKTWVFHFPGEWDDIINDGGRVSRNEVVDIVEMVNGKLLDVERGYCRGDSPWLYDEKVNALKEHILKEWVKSYEFDW